MPFEEVGVEAILEGLAGFERSTRRFNDAVASMGRSTDTVAGRVPRLTSALGPLLKGLGTIAISAGGAAVAGLGVLGTVSTRTAISVQSAFAGVAKTTDGLIDELGNLTPVGEEVRQEFRDLAKEIPATLEELLGIGELAGQLRVPREALAEFTKVVADLGETTNLTQEEAATALAQIANIFQVSTGDMAENTQQVGSALVDLGNNFATTERDILAFAQRIAGAGQIAGLTQDQVLAIGTALSSVGVQAEAGGTAVQKVLLTMVEAVQEGDEALETFAETAGQTTEEFAEAFEKDAAGAFQAFVEGLAEQGDEALTTLDDLELGDQRLIRSLLSLAGAGDLLGETLAVSAQAFDENTALTKEAETRYRTTEAQLQILKNTFRDLGITIGDALLPFLNRMVEAARPIIEELAQRLPVFIETFLIPALNKIIEIGGQVIAWLTTNLPAATETAGGILQQLAEFFDPIVQEVLNVVAAFMIHWPQIQETAARVFAFLQEIFGNTLPVIRDNVASILNSIAQIWFEHGDEVINTIEALWKIASSIFATLMAGISAVVAAVLALIAGDWEGFKDAVLGFVTALMENSLALVGTNLEEFKETWRNNLEAAKLIVSTILDRIVTAIAEKISDWVRIGENLVQGLIDGLRSKFADAIALVKEKIEELKNLTKDLLGISSESKVFRMYGNELARGLATGFLEAFTDPLRAIQTGIGAISTAARTMPVMATPAQSIVNRTVNVEVNANYSQIQSPADVRLDVMAALSASRT